MRAGICTGCVGTSKHCQLSNAVHDARAVHLEVKEAHCSSVAKMQTWPQTAVPNRAQRSSGTCHLNRKRHRQRPTVGQMTLAEGQVLACTHM